MNIFHTIIFMQNSNAQQATDTTQNQEPKIASIGKIERVTMTFPQEGVTTNNDLQNQDNSQGDQNNDATTNNEGADATPQADNGGAVENKNATTPPAPTLPTPDQLKEYFKSLNIEYEGDDKIKEKLAATQNQPQLTDEQVKAQEAAKEKRVLDKFISGGGTIDQFVALRQVAEADVKELSTNTLKKELKDAGFNDQEIDGIIKERYYQYGDEDLEQLEDETDKAFAKRKKEYGDKLLSNRSLPIKTQAANILKGIQDAINSEDLDAQNEEKISSKIEDDFKALPRKLKIEIGVIGKDTVPPVDYDVSEQDLAEVKAILKDPAQRQQLLLNPDGSWNITRITQALLKEKAFDSAAKISYLEAQTRNNAIWMEKFGARSPQEIGIGGIPKQNNGNQKNQPAGVGKVQRVQPQRQ